MKKHLKIALTLWLLGSFQAVAFANLNDGLDLYYGFDTDEGATVSDLSGKGHSGTVHGAAFTSEGKSGGAYHFDGIDDYILAGDLGDHPVGTISFWMNADAVENWRNPFSTDYASWDDNIRFEESSSGEFNGGGHGLGRGGEYTRTLDPHLWYHVVYVWDENFAYGYLNGDLKFKNPHPDPNSLVHPSLPLTAGQYKQTTLAFANVAIGNGYSTDPERYWKGLVDEVRVYDRPLSAQEVIQLYENKEDGLVLHYSFDQAPQGGVVKDESGKGNDGVVNGAVAYLPDGGQWKGGVEFHGTGESIKVAHSDSLNVGDHLTFAAWYKMYDRSNLPDKSDRQNPILDYSNGVESGAHLWTNTIGFQWNDKGTGANLIDTTGNENDYVISIDDKDPNEWHQLVVTYDGTSGTARLYMDGVLTETKALGVFTPQTCYDLYIGKRIWDNIFMAGVLDELRIYDRVLSDREVAALYDATSLGIVYQNFEENNGTPPPFNGSSPLPEYCFAINGGGTTADVSNERAHWGERSCKIFVPSPQEFKGASFPSQVQTYNVNFQKSRHDRLTFWIWANPDNGLNNEVRVRFFDHHNYNANGYEVFSANHAIRQEWTKITVLFTDLPADFDWAHVDKINIVNKYSGTYFIDDLQVGSDDRYYQAFEPARCATADDCGWTWDGTVSLETQNVYEGKQAWKLKTNNNNWSGTGVVSQEKEFFHTDLNPAGLTVSPYENLSFWIYGSAPNRMNNDINIQFFDQGTYKVNYFGQWTPRLAAEKKWSKITVPLSVLPANFNIHDIDKIQLQTFWPGTYIYDDIRVSKSPLLNINKAYLSSGIVTWEPFIGATNYTAEESVAGPAGHWEQIYSGPDPIFLSDKLSSPLKPAWLRVRWETADDGDHNRVPYRSDWSETAMYQPKPILIEPEQLANGVVEWTFIPQSSVYEIQEGNSRNGPWTTPSLYTGGYSINPIPATPGQWYHARAVGYDENGQQIQTEWGPAVLNDASAFVKAAGTVLREQNGFGPEITLRGVNLGNYLLIEPWMFFGDQHPFKTTYPDDWTIRHTLENRPDIGQAGLVHLLRTYQHAYIEEEDFDQLWRMGANAVRLPVYYRDIRELDDQGNWVVGSSYDFQTLDRVVRLCAERGLYVILDLHGAPGSQSKEFHTGRKSAGSPTLGFYHKLFDPADDTYQQRTEELWIALAQHFKNDPTVAGYDLLNEPFGAIDAVYHATPQEGYAALWALYDRLYAAIRDPLGVADGQHLIIMESIPSSDDWATLPAPFAHGWTNVMYEFHYYGFTFNSTGEVNGILDPAQHIDYIDGKAQGSRQGQYQVPVLIGEYNGFNDRANWDYYCQTFRNYHWSSTMWSQKVHDSPTEWGIFNHSHYEQSVPDAANDTLAELDRKLSQYDTLTHHTANESLKDAVIDAFAGCASIPLQQNSLKVRIFPPAAVTAGAQWRLTQGPDNGWKNSGESLINLPSGRNTIRFKAVRGWERPADIKIQVSNGSYLILNGNYRQLMPGHLKVTIQPQAAINAGAQWRLSIDPETAWKNSGVTVDLVPDNYTVVFKKIKKFTKPENKKVQVLENQSTNVNGTYH